ncbi:PKD domain-containing protein [Lunatibacter salilacus]|uniref:PKD domain-containing protein n=1 Tax=Lunatibacter salilacus TaxID=2483804 RepID=UPI00131AD6B9|nr:PKD domain-containing protein [Lunatibacter salilacus]
MQTFYRGEFEIKLSDLQIDYSGDVDDLVLSVLPGVDYEIVNGTTIVPSINYANNWPAAGEILPVNIQLSDGVDQSAVFPFEILVIPPISSLSYTENNCQGTISILASAYKPTAVSVVSFPFVFELFDSNGLLFDTKIVDYQFPFVVTANATFGLDPEKTLDREESYTLVVTDNLGRQFTRTSDPIGEAYAVDIALNFAGVLCGNDMRGVAEFVVSNASLPLETFLIVDENGDDVFSNFTNNNIISQLDGFVVVQVENLVPGKYELTIVDQLTCSGSEPFEIVIPSPIVIEEEITPVSCPENLDGAIRLEIEGGWSQPFPGNPREEWTQYNVEWFTAAGETVGNGVSQFIRDGTNQIIGVENVLGGLPTGSFYAEISDRGRIYEFPNTDPLACVVTTPVFVIEGPEILNLNSQFNDISCFGEGDGTIEINPTGGIPNYQIEWFVGHFDDLRDPIPADLQPLAGTNLGDLTVENLEEGEYAVLLRDTNGCFIAENFTISEPQELIISEVEAERLDIRCFGESTGQYTVSIDQESVGPYTVQTHFMGGTPGSVQVVTRNESGPFTYVNMAAGNYQIIITDANGCVKTIDNILLSQPVEGLAIENLSISDFNGYGISCAGANDGSISLEVSGGSGDLIFGWTGPNGFTSTETSLTGLGPGIYEFTVTDENECSATTGEVIITEPDVLSIDPIVSEFNGFQISCHGAADGSILPNVSGGVQPLTYRWTGTDGFESNAPILENLGPGTYSLTLTDANDCSIFDEFDLIEPEELIVEENEDERINVTCFGQSTGSISVEWINESVGPYTLNIGEMGSLETAFEILDFNGTSYAFENLPSGNYWIDVIDANGCNELLENILITQPAEGLDLTDLNISEYNGFQISCFGAADGSIHYELTGNQGEVTYSWTGPEGYTSIDQNLENLGPGTYMLQIADESGCELNRTFILEEPEVLALDDAVSDYNGFQITCNGGADGYIRLFPTGGNLDYTFLWTGTNGFTSTSKDLEGIAAGTYEVIIQDANGCTITREYVITEPEGLEISELEEQRVNVLCFGQSTGEVHVSVSRPSTSPYNYYIQETGAELGSAGTAEEIPATEWVFGNLPAGFYELTVVDANGCTEQLSGIEITQPESGVTISAINISDYNGFEISCYGAQDGHIEVILTGGSGDYVYEWTGPNGFTAATSKIENIGLGMYELTITDTNGCAISTGELEITEPDQLALNENVSDYNGFGISCYGGSDGYISISPSGGTSEYSIAWSGPNGFTATESRIDNLEPGIYNLLLEDENGCFVTETYALTEPPLLEAGVMGTVDVLCSGEPTGGVTLEVSGGASPDYLFSWRRNGNEINELGQNPTTLLAGNYEVTVTDINGCAIVLTDISINEPPTPLEVVLTSTEVSCYNANDGSITSEITGGVPPYQISWNFGSIQSNLIGIGPGLYEITVTDANACVVIESVSIEEVPVFDINPEVIQISCFGENNGSINLNLVGGQAPVRALWDHGPEQAAIFNLGPGEYSVTIVEGAGCEFRRTFFINEPEILIAVGIVDDALECTDGQSGSINLTVSGGSPPYIYEWSNGESTEDLTNLTSGWYSVNVTDQSGCFSTQRFQVRRPQPIQVSHITYQEIQCEPRNIRDVFDIKIDGGVAPYTINWSHGDISSNGYQMSTEEPGLYFLTVKDAAGCEYSETFEVDNNKVLFDGEFRSQSLLDYGAHLVNLDIEFINRSSGNILSYYWDFGDGNASMEESPIHRYQEEGTYTVTLRVVDLYGCEQARNFEIEIWDHFLEVPNVFSPNGDGMNDYFFPKFLQIADINFRVVNKWGEVVFHSDELQSIGWDGRLNGDDAQVGNYVYQVSYHTLDGRFFTKNGVFLLMK